MKTIKQRQSGVALFIVIVVVMLSMLLAIWASRTAWFGEILVGNNADYQRAFEAAQAMLQDAELDIRGETSNGMGCEPVSSEPKICRQGALVWFINEDKEFSDLIYTLDSATSTKCIEGICQKRQGKQDFWNDKITLAAMTANNVGARYGEYTGAKTGPASNPILSKKGAGEGAWYWIEIMLYEESSAGLINVAATESTKKKWNLSLKPNTVYRITAIARGLKPNTQVVLQSTFARQKLKD